MRKTLVIGDGTPAAGDAVTVPQLSSAPADPAATWYALFSRPRMEALALATLTALGYTAWLPLCLLERRHARKTETVRAPLFPRYLFLALVDGRGLAPALGVSGVAGVVRTRSGEPLAVQRGDLDRLRARIERAGGAIDLRPRTASEHYALGDRLTVRVGAFGAELPVVIEAAADGRMTAVLDILGRKVAVRRLGQGRARAENVPSSRSGAP